MSRYLPENHVALTLHFLLHGSHHYLPKDRYRLVKSPILVAILAIPLYRLTHIVFFWDWFVATTVFCGGMFGYISFDVTHYFLHHTQ